MYIYLYIYTHIHSLTLTSTHTNSWRKLCILAITLHLEDAANGWKVTKLRQQASMVSNVKHKKGAAGSASPARSQQVATQPREPQYRPGRHGDGGVTKAACRTFTAVTPFKLASQQDRFRPIRCPQAGTGTTCSSLPLHTPCTCTPTDTPLLRSGPSSVGILCCFCDFMGN